MYDFSAFLASFPFKACTIRKPYSIHPTTMYGERREMKFPKKKSVEYERMDRVAKSLFDVKKREGLKHTKIEQNKSTRFEIWCEIFGIKHISSNMRQFNVFNKKRALRWWFGVNAH